VTQITASGQHLPQYSNQMPEELGGRKRRESGVSPLFKLFILPPLLALAVVAPALLGFMSYQTERSMETTYVVSSLQKSRACSLCHNPRQPRVVALR
jgi:hypothetical protein